MSQVRIFLMRHGQVVQAIPRRFLGQRNVPLDETGRAQAESAGRWLRGISFDRAVCSDLDRARETAGLLLQDRDITVETEPRLREIHLGQWEGLTVDEVRAAFPGEYEARGKDLARAVPRGGESFLDLQQRVAPCFEEIARQGTGTVLLVAHAGVNRAILCHVLGLDLENLFRLGQDYCCLNIITQKDGQFQVERMNIIPRPDMF